MGREGAIEDGRKGGEREERGKEGDEGKERKHTFAVWLQVDSS